MTDRALMLKRAELLGTCAMIAATIALAHGSESFAQSALQGTPTVASGDAYVNRGGPSGGSAAVDTIGLNSQSAIINWNTFDQTTNTTIDFLPQNTVARFQGGQDFVVLNRVFAATPGQAISINGTVLSQDFSSQTTGSIWFYSPGGIIAGPTSVFNVGNLILTADDIDTTNGLFGQNNTIRFRGTAGSTSGITVQPGAQFNLANTGSYLALVAPQVTMGGTATINGSTAYIAAEQVDVRINGGAFDIAFLAGTGVANALIHSGTTTGPAMANGNIVLAAMPKNTAITMLVGGTLGYTPAATASIQNGTVILSAGQDLVSGTPSQTSSGTAAANLTIGSAAFTSSVNAQATDILAGPNGGGPLSFSSNAILTGRTGAEMRADAGELITVAGNLAVVARRPGVGGTARLIADGVGSLITVTGITQVDASAFGAANLSGPGGNAVGGTAEIVARQGSISTGLTGVSANGVGGYGSTQSGNGTGGIARVRAEQSGSFGLLTGNLFISAVGIGGQGGIQFQSSPSCQLGSPCELPSPFPTSPVGGNGIGGQALYEIANQGFSSTGTLALVADAIGGTGGTTGGNASAGTAQIDMGTGTLSSGATTISANETGGFAGNGGTTGSTSGSGIAGVRTQSGSVQLNSLSMSADANVAGGTRIAGSAPGIEGAIRAGTSDISADAGSVAVNNGLISVSASAFGTSEGLAITAGAVTAGRANISATNNGSISSLGMNIQADAIATAASVTPGNATGGQITLSNSGFGSFALDPNDVNHEISLSAYAVGASGGAPASATGGQIVIDFGQGIARGISTFSADTTGYAGASTTGGLGATGRGGTVDLTLGFDSEVTADSFNLTADGASIAEREGLIGPGAGSAGIGGTVTVAMLGGTFNSTSFNISSGGRGAFAFAAPGNPGTVAGTGTGGTTSFTIDGTSATIGTIRIDAIGFGGGGGDGLLESNVRSSAGGNGTGGNATLQLNSGQLFADSIEIDAGGIGGDGGFGEGTDGARGGNGTGGTATFRNLAESIIGGNRIVVSAEGSGGYGGSSYYNGAGALSFDGGNGGSGTGGTALIDWQGDLSTQVSFPPSLAAYAGGEGIDGGSGYDNALSQSGKFGGQGGDSAGGTSTILISGRSARFSSITAVADSVGGNSQVGNATRRGGDAIGGTAEVRVIDAPLAVGVLNISSTAEAGNPDVGRFGAGPRGGDATGGTSLLEVSGINGSYVATDGGQYAYGNTPVFTMSADARASSGITGRDGTTPNAGGRGGNAVGGQVTVRARDGLINIASPTLVGIYVDAFGGDGGIGGNTSTYQPTGGGAGGDAGSAVGGTINFSAQGGQIVLGDIALTSSARAGSAGYGGIDAGRPASPGVPAIPATNGPYGLEVFGSGGTINIETQTNNESGRDGQITAGNLTATIGGTTNGYGDFGYAGSVSISNLNSGGGALNLGALTVDAGPPTYNFYGGATTLAAYGAPINVDGDIRVVGPTSFSIQTSGAGSVIASGVIDVNVQGYVSIDQVGGTGQPALKAASITAAGGNGVSTGTPGTLIAADTDILLSSSFGSVNAGILTAGRDVGVTVNGAGISLGGVNAGRNAVISGSPTTSAIAVGPVAVGGYLEARGASLGFGNVTAGTDAILSTYNGALTVGDVTAGDDIFLTVNGSFANPNTVSPDSQTGQTSTTVNTLVAGNLRSTGQGSDTAASGPATFTGAEPTGNVVRVRGSGNVTTGNIASADRIIVVSDLARVTTGSLTAPGGIAALARTGVGLGAVDTGGLFIVRSADQFPLLTTNYQIAGLNAGSVSNATYQTLGQVDLTTVRAASVQVNADAAIGYGSITTTGTVDLGNAYSTQGNNVTGGAIAAGGVVGILSTGNISFTSITTPTNASIAGSGTITGTSLSASTFSLSGRTGIDVAAASATAPASSPGFSTLQATNGVINVPNLQSFTPISAFGRSVFAHGPGALTFNVIQATAGDIDVSASDGLAVIDARATGDIVFDTDGAATLDTISSGRDLAVTAGDINVRIGTGAGRALRFDAEGLISVNGGINAPSIELRSGSINIGGEYRVGTIGYTQQLSLTNTANTQTFIGGAKSQNGYSLSGSEMTRLAAENISVLATPQSQNQASGSQSSLALTPNVAPDLILDTLTVTGGQNLGVNGTLSIQTRGKMRVVGTVTLDGMTVSNRLELIAVTAIEALPNSSIVIRNTGGLTGTLDMTAEDIIASSPAALADVAAATTLTSASDRLGANNGTASDDGYFQAGGIVVKVSRGIYVQNTGTSTTTANRDYATRRGFTVGSNGFTVAQTSSAPVRVAINGRQVSTTTSPSGTPTNTGFVTGIDLAPLIKFVPFDQPSNTAITIPATGLTGAQQQQAAAIFDPLSTVNGCAIIASGACGNGNEPVITINDPIRDILQGDFGEGAVANLLPLSIVQLKDYATAGDEPLIDEPVTGAGNDDLWSVDDSTKCDPAKEACK